jgi:hypothetical protein
MKSNTHTLTIDAPAGRVFDFVSKVENLPKWAKAFCRDLRTDDRGRWKVLAPDGEIFFGIDADARAGVVDMSGGPDPGAMSYWPARVVARPDGGSLFIFTAFQYPGMTDAQFEATCEGLKTEFPHLKALAEAHAQ